MGFVRRPIIAAGLLALTIGAAAACGSSSSGGQAVSPSGGTSSSPTAGGVNAAAVALVPANIKSKGSITVASDASYAPMEFLDTDGTTVIGADADLAAAIGKSLGLDTHVTNVTFDNIIPGLVDGKFDLGMSSFTDTKEREKQVNFVTYFTAGTSFFVKADGGPTVNALSDLCGKKVAVEAGTTEETDAKAQAKKCKVTVQSYQTQSQANLALSSGRADVVMADTPVAAYQVQKSNGTFKLEGEYGSAPYGIAVPKSAGTMDQAVLASLKGLIADGTYAEILKKWGLSSGAITDPVINGAIS